MKTSGPCRGWKAWSGCRDRHSHGNIYRLFFGLPASSNREGGGRDSNGHKNLRCFGIMALRIGRSGSYHDRRYILIGSMAWLFRIGRLRRLRGRRRLTDRNRTRRERRLGNEHKAVSGGGPGSGRDDAGAIQASWYTARVHVNTRPSSPEEAHTSPRDRRAHWLCSE